MSGPVLVVAEHRGGRVAAVSAEVIACARELCGMRSADLRVALLGGDLGELGDELARIAGAGTVAVQGPGLEPYTAEAYLAALVELIAEEQPELICLAHGSQGLDLAPRLAARIGAACVTGVEAVGRGRRGRLVLSRLAHAGKVRLELAPLTGSTVLTVQPGAFEAAEPLAGGEVSAELRVSAAAPGRTRALGIEQVYAGAEAIAEAEVIVAAGRGVGGPEGLALVEKLAALFPGAAVAGSRPVCDAGWLPYSRQVGMTGMTVEPKLYIACGISGSRQHTAGMRGAGFVVAINSDPEAVINDLADVIVVEDLMSFLPQLIEEFE